MKRLVLTFSLALLFSQISFAQEPQYTGHLEPELAADPPMMPLMLKAATDQDKLLVPAVTDGDTIYVGAMNVGQGKERKSLTLFVIKSADEKRPSYLYVDLNMDGKLTADERVEYTQNAGSVIKQATVRIPMSGAIFKSYPIRLGFPNAVPGGGPGGSGPKGPFVLQSIYTVARGSVDIDGRKTLVEYSVGPSGEIDPTIGRVAVDCDGDGKIDSNLFTSTESLTARNESVVFRVDKHYVSTTSVDTTSGKIVLRSHPASDYTRIEMREGLELPDFTFVDFEGKTRKLSDFRGKYVLVDFWGTWCGPCVAEIPHLKEAYDKYRDRGFEILGMDREMNENQTVEKVKQFLEEKGAKWTEATTESIKDLVEKRFRIMAYPTTLLLDPHGKIVDASAGLRGKGLLETLEKIFPAK